VILSLNKFTVRSLDARNYITRAYSYRQDDKTKVRHRTAWRFVVLSMWKYDDQKCSKSATLNLNNNIFNQKHWLALFCYQKCWVVSTNLIIRIRQVRDLGMFQVYNEFILLTKSSPNLCFRYTDLFLATAHVRLFCLIYLLNNGKLTNSESFHIIGTLFFRYETTWSTISITIIVWYVVCLAECFKIQANFHYTFF
jgi:hypothetical protein